MQDIFDEWETETQKSIDEYFGDSDWSTTESTTEAYSYEARFGSCRINSKKPTNS